MASNDPKKPNESLWDRFNKVVDGISNEVSNATEDFGVQMPSMVRVRFFNAAKHNHTEVFEELLEKKFDLRATNNEGETALHVAAAHNAVEAARYLMTKGLNPRAGTKDDPKRTPLENAVLHDRAEMTEFLTGVTGYLPNPDKDGFTLLNRACRKGYRQSVKALLNSGVDCNETSADGATPLIAAIQSGTGSMIQDLAAIPAVITAADDALLNAGKTRGNALHLAVEADDGATVKLLINKGMDINRQDRDGRTPLFYAIENGNPDMVRYLLKKGADVNAPCGPEGTPLSAACKLLQPEEDKLLSQIIDLLIREGADTDIPDAAGRLPVHEIAATGRFLQSFSTLLSYPVEKDAADASGATPLIYTAQFTMNNPLRSLLDAGARPDGRHGEDARTALIEATRHNNVTGVELLLKAGANPALRDASGRSALSYARQNKRTDIIALLENALRARALKPQGPAC